MVLSAPSLAECTPLAHPLPAGAGWKREVEKANGLQSRELQAVVFLVGVVGFELTTPCTPCKCATRLRYTPKYSIIDRDLA